MELINAVKLIQSASSDHNWFGTSFNVNIYKGCNHGCIYCDSRSSCYQIHDFDRVRAKKDSTKKIELELSKKRKKGAISLGGMNDPYNPFEIEHKLTRNALKSINKHGFGVFVTTKSALVVRDIDILNNINQHSMVNVGITITTSDDKLQSRIERNVSSTTERFEALKKLSDQGIFCGVMMMPILPFINDTIENITNIVLKAKAANVDYIYPSFGVTLRANQRDYFYNKIGPELTKKYKETFQEKYMCVSPSYVILKKTFKELCKKHGILYKMEDIVKASFNRVKKEQISLF